MFFVVSERLILCFSRLMLYRKLWFRIRLRPRRMNGEGFLVKALVMIFSMSDMPIANVVCIPPIYTIFV